MREGDKDKGKRMKEKAEERRSRGAEEQGRRTVGSKQSRRNGISASLR